MEFSHRRGNYTAADVLEYYVSEPFDHKKNYAAYYNVWKNTIMKKEKNTN